MPLDSEAKSTLLRLRLLIVRAAQKDSLSWWEDESLTQAGAYLAERLFLMDTAEIIRALAVEAARTRHKAAFGDGLGRLHLFRLDETGEVELALRDARLSDFDVPHEPITSQDDLRRHLVALTDQAPKYELVGGIDASHCIEIRSKNPSNKISPVELATVLAWAWTESSPGDARFPFVRIAK